MLSPILQRDNRLRWAGFVIVTHTASGRRWWRLGLGLPIFDACQADSLLDMLIEEDFRPCGPGHWSRAETHGQTLLTAFYSTRQALDELKRATLALLRAGS